MLVKTVGNWPWLGTFKPVNFLTTDGFVMHNNFKDLQSACWCIVVHCEAIGLV